MPNLRPSLSSLPIITLLGVASALTGCGPNLRNATSGQIGCPPNEVTVSDHKKHFNSSTWTATCRGEVFYCSSATTGSSMATVGNTSYASRTGQYQCTRAVAKAEPVPAAAPAASATVATTPTADPKVIDQQKPFPDKVLGFSFASAPEAAQAACQSQGHEWRSGTSQAATDKDKTSQYECSGAGVDVGVPTRTILSYCNGGLCEVRAYATLAADAAGSEQLLKLENALLSQYGKPRDQKKSIPTDCRGNLPTCVAQDKAFFRYEWHWNDKSFIRVRLFTEQDAAILGVLYHPDQESAQIQRATDSLNTEAF